MDSWKAYAPKQLDIYVNDGNIYMRTSPVYQSPKTLERQHMKKMRPAVVYQIVDLERQYVGYVGQTTRVQDRWMAHRRIVQNHENVGSFVLSIIKNKITSSRFTWIDYLGFCGIPFAFEIIAYCETAYEAISLEDDLIKWYISNGQCHCNATKNNVYCPYEEERLVLIAAYGDDASKFLQQRRQRLLGY